MMKIVIIPSHNQSKHIYDIISGYENQTIIPDLILFVFDRCSDDSIDLIKCIKSNLRIEYIEKFDGNNFSAGMTRDYGIDYVQKNYPEYEMIVFTDGDCIPSKRLVEIHLENIRQTKKCVVSCGARNKQNESGEFEQDERLDKKWINGFSFGEKNSRLIVNNFLTLNNIFTYSCNFAFNKNAIELCQNINMKLSGCKRVFNKEFDGSWGGEDSFISHCMYRTGNYILMTSLDCYVDHFWHPEVSKENNKNKKNLQNSLSIKLKELILSGEIEGPIQYITKGYQISFGSMDDINQINNIVEIKNIENILNHYIEYVCEKYELKKHENIFKYFLINNLKVINYNGVRVFNNNKDIFKYRQMLGYMKFYLNDDKIVFLDDVDDFKLIENDGKFLDYV